MLGFKCPMCGTDDWRSSGTTIDWNRWICNECLYESMLLDGVMQVMSQVRPTHGVDDHKVGEETKRITLGASDS